MYIKIKIIRRKFFHNGCFYVCYDTYHGFTGMPSTWPFMTKWVKDKSSLSEEELQKHILNYLTTVGKVKIIVKTQKQ